MHTRHPRLQPNIQLGKGAGVYVPPYCTDPSCAYLYVNLTGFPANSRIGLNCWDSYPDNGYFWPTVYVNTNGSGSYSGQLVCYYGYPRRQVRVRFGESGEIVQHDHMVRSQPMSHAIFKSPANAGRRSACPVATPDYFSQR